MAATAMVAASKVATKRSMVAGVADGGGSGGGSGGGTCSVRSRAADCGPHGEWCAREGFETTRRGRQHLCLSPPILDSRLF